MSPLKRLLTSPLERTMMSSAISSTIRPSATKLTMIREQARWQHTDESKPSHWTEHWTAMPGGRILVLCAYGATVYWIGRSYMVQTATGHILSTTVEEPKALDLAREQPCDFIQSSVADGIKWIENMDDYRDRLWRDIQSQCKAKCHDGLKSCPILLRLGELHKHTCKPPREAPKALDTNKATPAEGIEWIEETEKYRSGLWYDLIIGECTKRCREGLKSCSIVEELKKMHAPGTLAT